MIKPITKPVLASLLIAVLAAYTSRTQAADHKALVDEAVEPYVKAHPHAAVVVGLLSPAGREVYGYCKFTIGDQSHTPDGKTVSEIGSITKVFTGTTLATLVLEEKAALDDPVAKHLPQPLQPPSYEDQQITLEHLATHRSSLGRLPPLMGLFLVGSNALDNPYAKYTTEDLGRTMAIVKLDRPIGSKFEYSNFGAALLGQALVHTSGAESFEQLVVDRICTPLGMSDTRATLNDEQQSRFARGFNAAGKPTSTWEFDALAAAGALRSTADDMLTFAAANLGQIETPLYPAMQLAHQERAKVTPNDIRIGLCWMRHGGRALYHNGGTGGYRSFLGIAPQAKAGVVVLANTAHEVEPAAVKLLKQLLAE